MYPELWCDWPVHNKRSWNFSGVHGFLSLTGIWKMSIVTAFRSMVQAVYPYWFFAMRCCFQAPQQWCWATRPQYVFFVFFFLYFFFIRPTEPKSGNAFEAKRKKSAVDEVSFVSQRSILSSDSKVELPTEWIVLCESTTFTWLCSLQIYKLHVTTEQGWLSGESTHLPPMWPGFKSWRRRHMWVEFVVDSLP